MKTVSYSSPFVPVEWTAAHGLQPRWMRLRSADGGSPVGVNRGVCPYAGALLQAARSDRESAAMVMTTTCDQMRHAAALAEGDRRLPVFLMNVPSTWQTAGAGRLYRAELERLGRFLAGLGGKAPSREELARVMVEYDAARLAVCAARDRLSARQFAEVLARLRGSATATPDPGPGRPPSAGVPLAILGGPLLDEDYGLLDLLEESGGRVVLDATEGGERTMPAPFDRRQVRDDPLGELARAYFGSIPDAFRRPNGGLYEWLGPRMAARGVRGIVFRRYLWCDLWHAELHRLRRWSPVPVLDLDVGDRQEHALCRTLGRVEAFLEMLP